MQLFPLGDDNFGSLKFPFNFRYFGNNFNSLILSTNGFVVFSSTTRCCSLFMPKISNSIAAHSYDMTTLTSGRISYQVLNAISTELSTVKDDINKLSPSFTPTNAFRIIFENVSDYKTGSHFASFEISLATDSSSAAFAALKYTRCLTNAADVTLLAISGLNYINIMGQLATVPISTSPCNSSNVNTEGTWIFNVQL